MFGLPRLKDKIREKVQEANLMAKFALDLLEVQHSLGQDRALLLEHPEDLGSRSRGDPGSIWRWKRVRAFGDKEGVKTGALRQSDWGRYVEKPTRLLFRLPGLEKAVNLGWPVLSEKGVYQGPLEKEQTQEPRL